MNDWNNYYNEWTVEDYRRHIEAWKGFCHRVMRFTPDNGRIMEFGTGTGQMSIYLSTKGYRCHAIDQDDVIVKRARHLSTKVGGHVFFRHKSMFDYELEDDMPKFDTVFSQGLLEHFEDYKIREILHKKKSIGDVVAFSVPLDKFGHQSKGDERLLPIEHWRELVEGFEKIYESTFCSESQLIMVVK